MNKKNGHDTTKNTSSDAAQLTQEDTIHSSVSGDVHPSYYDTAFSATTTHTRPTIMDTGARSHMFGARDAFRTQSNISPTRIRVASKGGAIWATMKGSLSFGGIALKNVLYSDHLTGNLISIGRLCDEGYTAVFYQKHGHILDSEKRIVLHMIRDPNSD